MSLIFIENKIKNEGKRQDKKIFNNLFCSSVGMRILEN